MTRPQVIGHLSMLAFSACVAGSFSLGARTAYDIAPDALTAVRFWLAALVLGVVGAATGQLGRRNLVLPWRYFVLGGLFMFYVVMMFEGLKTAPPVSAAAVFTLTPLMAAGFAWLILRQRLTGRMTLALLIGAAGALWVIFRADLAALLQFEVGRGEVIYFIGCISHAVYIPLVRRMNRGEGPMQFAFGTSLAGALLLTVWAWPSLRATDWISLRPLVWVTLFYAAIIATVVTVILMQVATMRLPSAKVMAYTYLTPSWVILWELALGGAVPPVLVLAGFGLTLLALGLLLRDDDPVPIRVGGV